MTIRVILTLPASSKIPEPHYLQQLLRDAFGEFISARDAEHFYVETRYPHMNAEQRDKKREDVLNRKRLAEALKRADVTIDIIEE